MNDNRINKIADKITEFCGDLRFVVVHVIWWTIWLAFGVEPFPYGLLTLAVSLEAIILSTFILISQNRTANFDRKIMHDDLKLDKDSYALLLEIKELLKDN